MKKDAYSIDNFNRLLVRRGRKKLVADGRFNVDKDNALDYWLNEPAHWRRENSLPPKIKFRGKWDLSRNYDLELVLDKTEGHYLDNRLSLKAEIISVDCDKLVFQMQSRDKDGQSHIQIIKLSGVWQADEFNRIVFEVKKKEEPDVLLFSGAWQVNKNQQIIYDYEKTALKTKDRISNTLTFRGFWEIDSRNRLAYILSGSPDSRFDFRAQLESPDLYPKEGVIKYRLGVGFKNQKPGREKIISLYGAWRFSRKAGLNFEIDYGAGQFRAIEFGADIYLTKENNFAFCLSSKNNEPLGITVIFTHRFLKKLDAELFVKLKNSYRESAVEAGVRIPF